jgi:hypothetical protein
VLWEKRATDAFHSPTGVVTAARTEERDGAQQGKSGWVSGTVRCITEQATREGWAWPGQMADGPVVPLRPGNAGGGKGPCPWTREESGESQEIDR